MSETPHEDPVLFDLPIAPAPPPPAGGEVAAIAPRRARRPAGERPESLSLFAEEPPDDFEAPAVPESRSARATARPERSRPVALPPPPELPAGAGLPARLRASAGDLVVIAAVGTLAIAGARWLDAPVAVELMPAILAFLLAWSFLYFVISLAFWGQTPGMAWAGLIARTGAAEPLSFGQTARRWAATWLTWMLAGLPGLLALTGRSLADRLSGSRTYEIAGAR